ncbi:MAG: alpha-D-xyloside xylohydrolase [Cryomorphaceae bacterium]|jgi:alpha-D-xyloside xylohydrolase
MNKSQGTLLPGIECPNWNAIEATSILQPPHCIDTSSLSLQSSDGELRLEVTAHGVRLRSASERACGYGLLTAQVEPVPLDLQAGPEHAVVEALDLRITIGYQPFSLDIQSIDGERLLRSPSDGHFVRRHRVPPLAKTDQGWLFCIDLSSGEEIYGLGEKWGPLNKRGQLLRSYNQDALGVNAEVSYKNIPFCWSPNGWGMLVHTPAAVTHSVGYAPWSQRSYCALIEDDHLDVFIFTADSRADNNNTGAKLISDYTALTGRAPMPPSWSTGVILSKAYYQDAEEILSVAREVRERGMPCDVITFDGRAWQDTDTRFAFEWSPSRYPDPKKVIDELKKMGFKICVWEYPLISTKHAWFDEFADKGWLLKDKRTGQAYQYDWDQQAFGSVLTSLPRSGIVDFTSPEAYAFWRDAHKDLFDLGVDMIKADFGEQLEDDNMLASNGEFGLALHNVYAHLYNKCVYEAAEMYSPSGPFLFSRAAWTGCQRFNSHWGGDPQADWEGMISNIRGGLSWGLTGGPFYATDVGGFYKDTRDDTLYVRWAQAAIFSAHFRLHGIGEREPWSYSAAAEQAVMQALDLRYRLHTYLINAMRQASESSLPVQRAMVLAFPQEKQAWSFENQFMFGDDLLVVPCFDPQGMVEFYLPEGHWFRFSPEQEVCQDVLLGQRVYRQKLALNEMAVFARSGAKIPLNAAVKTTDELTNNNEIKYWKATSSN